MLVSVVLTIVCHVIFVVYLFLIDCCCHCCLFQLRFARRQFEVQPVRDVLPPFLSLIVCDLISDGGAYLQFAGRCRPTSSGASLHLLKCLLVLVPPSLHLIKCLLVLVAPSLTFGKLPTSSGSRFPPLPTFAKMPASSGASPTFAKMPA